ncbi:hypothetical protein CBP31_06915 [Oceanisphaera profunda]|uniref:Uncharacterized protein n=1 Tax=Oceanisphaera profunda TaxID=1416627 RepID=A0A1Y0D5E3_9GAMM|nr:hypothetical protein [Oceanisphaera profunda]ART82386.1 hypothetical protein CBP31_06915 [Oceanisphaera profunda]
MQEQALFSTDGDEYIILLTNPHHIALAPLALNGIQQWDSLQAEGLTDAMIDESPVVILLEPSEAELSRLARANRRGFWLAVLPFDSSAAQRAALTERVDHLVLAHRDQFKLLVRDLTELITRKGLIATDLYDIRTVLNSGQGISHYHSGTSLPCLDTGNIGSYMSDTFDHYFPHNRLAVLSVLTIDLMTFTWDDFSAYGDYFIYLNKSIHGYLAPTTRNAHSGELMRVGCFVVQEAKRP